MRKQLGTYCTRAQINYLFVFLAVTMSSESLVAVSAEERRTIGTADREGEFRLRRLRRGIWRGTRAARRGGLVLGDPRRSAFRPQRVCSAK